jgi:hypothetical protein
VILSANALAAIALIASLSGVPALADDSTCPDPNAAIRPDTKLTPGEAQPRSICDKEQVCEFGYSKKHRYVRGEMKHRAFDRYAIPYDTTHYEVDHLISVALCGTNNIGNLWPESRCVLSCNAQDKDSLERRLHDLVCDGTIDLETAQHDMATDWVAAYQKYVGKSCQR